MKDLSEYWNLFQKDEEYTCYVYKDDALLFRSRKKGVSPLLAFYDINGKKHNDLTVVDKIMGKGAVVLSILIGAKRISTPIISQIALHYAIENELIVSYRKIVPYIKNRDNNGNCPIENSLLNIDNPTQALKAIVYTIADLKKES